MFCEIFLKLGKATCVTWTTYSLKTFKTKIRLSKHKTSGRFKRLPHDIRQQNNISNAHNFDLEYEAMGKETNSMLAPECTIEVMDGKEDDDDDQNDGDEESGDSNIATRFFEGPDQQFKFFKCEFCPETFTLRQTFSLHTKVVHEQCQICQKTFGKKETLIAHLQTAHKSRKRTHKCDICTKTFGKLSGLNRHVKFVHDKIRAFECDVCYRSFGLEGILKQHIRIKHENERAFKCEFCSKDFGGKSGLKKQVSVVHENRNQFYKTFMTFDGAIRFHQLLMNNLNLINTYEYISFIQLTCRIICLSSDIKIAL